MVEITGLFIYPVKGLRGISVSCAELTERGLRSDRHWMVVMPNGRMVTQRQKPLLAGISAVIDDQYLLLSCANRETLKVPLEPTGAPLIETTVWRDCFLARDTGEEASIWLTEALDSEYPLRLVAMDEHQVRPQSSPELLGEETHTAFADAAPFLVTSEASLEVLNGELEQSGIRPVPMNRFRPNIVVRGLPAFAEYKGGALKQAEDRYRIGLKYPSERCVVITTDQHTGNVDRVSREPLATLKRMNTAPGCQGAYFGENAILEEGVGATIRVGDILVQ